MEIERIEPAKTAMIVVDMQNDFVAPGGGLETPAAREMVPIPIAGSARCPTSRSMVILAASTAHVMSVAEIARRIGVDFHRRVREVPSAIDALSSWQRLPHDRRIE